VGLGHTALHTIQDPHTAAHRHVGKAVLDGLGGGPLVAQARHSQQRADQINAQHHQRCPQRYGGQAMGDQAEQRQQKRVAPLEQHDAQHAPGGRCTQADVTVQVERHSAVIPPAGVGGALQNVPADPLNDGGVDGAEHKEEEPAVAAHIPQSKRDDQTADAVQNAQRAAQNAPVLVLAADRRRKDDLPHPAQERVSEK